MSKIVYTRETTNDNIGTVETFYEAQADELSGETLSPYFESSESVTKSLNGSGNIEFSVNADITQKVNRAILTPANTPSEDVVPVVDSTNAVSYKPLSEIGGGGGGGGGLTPRELTYNEFVSYITNPANAFKLVTVFSFIGGEAPFTLTAPISYVDMGGATLTQITGALALLVGHELSSIYLQIAYTNDTFMDNRMVAETYDLSTQTSTGTLTTDLSTEGLSRFFVYD